jgi:hypothetical protein
MTTFLSFVHSLKIRSENMSYVTKTNNEVEGGRNLPTKYREDQHAYDDFSFASLSFPKGKIRNVRYKQVV